MNNHSKSRQKAKTWMSDKYMPPNRERRGKSSDRDNSSGRYRRRSPGRHEPYSQRERNNWRYDENRGRHQNPSHLSYMADSYHERRRSCYDASGPYDRPPKGATPYSKHGQQSSTDREATSRAREHFNVSRYISEHMQNTMLETNSPGGTRNPMLYTPNELIQQLIADEAIRMLAGASDTSEMPTELLHEAPCEDENTENTVPAVDCAGSERSPAQTPSTQPAPASSKPAAAKVTTVPADNALLQKSAEQVTRKLINQLTTMNKYNLKQMIDNPAGKYETALNRHAQNKLRAQVRKQLKSFNLAEAVRAKDSGTFGSDVVAPDEAIDAEKIPAALLEQIGQVLDMDFFDLTGSTVSEPHVEVGDADEAVSSAGDKQLTVETDKREDTVSENVSIVTLPQAAEIMEKTVDYGANVSPVRDPETRCHQPAAPTTITSEADAVPENGSPTNGKTAPERKAVVSFLRVSTVDELNKRLTETNTDELAATSSAPQEDGMNVPEARGSTAGRRGDGSAEYGIAAGCSEPNGSDGFVQTQLEAITNDAVTLSSNDPRVPSKPSPIDGPARESCVSVAVAETSRHDSSTTIPAETLLHSTAATESDSIITKRPIPVPMGAGKVNKQKPPVETASSVTQQTNQPGAAMSSSPSHKRMNERKKRWKKLPHPSGAAGNEAVDEPTLGCIAANGDSDAVPPHPLLLFPEGSEPDRTAGPTNEPSRATPKMSRWDRTGAVATGSTGKASHGAVRNACSQSSESAIAMSDQPTPKKGCDPTAGRRKNAKRGWTLNIAGEQKSSPKKSRKKCHQRDPALEAPPEVATVDQEMEEQASVEADALIRSTSEQNDLAELRIANMGSLLEPAQASAPTDCAKSELPSEERLNEFTALDCTAPDATNDPGTTIPVVPSELQEAPLAHMDYSNVGNSPTTPLRSTSPPEDMPPPELIVPDLISPRAQHQQQQPQTPPPLGLIMDQMQAIDTQTMELFKRKMDIDACIMKLNGERMEIDQQIVRLQNARDEQTNALRFALMLVPFPSAFGGTGMQHQPTAHSGQLPIVYLPPSGEQPPDPSGLTDAADYMVNRAEETDRASTGSGSYLNASDAHRNTPPQHQPATNGCHERTIRRITKLSGNSELLRIFHRRRLLSDRSSDDNHTTNEESSVASDLPGS